MGDDVISKQTSDSDVIPCGKILLLFCLKMRSHIMVASIELSAKTIPTRMHASFISDADKINRFFDLDKCLSCI